MIRHPGYILSEINSKVQPSPWVFSFLGSCWGGNEVCVPRCPEDRAPHCSAAGVQGLGGAPPVIARPSISATSVDAGGPHLGAPDAPQPKPGSPLSCRPVSPVGQAPPPGPPLSLPVTPLSSALDSQSLPASAPQRPQPPVTRSERHLDASQTSPSVSMSTASVSTPASLDAVLSWLHSPPAPNPDPEMTPLPPSMPDPKLGSRETTALSGLALLCDLRVGGEGSPGGKCRGSVERAPGYEA